MPQTPTNPDPEQGGSFLERLLSFIPSGFQALAKGETPADESLKAGGRRLAERGAGVPMPDVIRGLMDTAEGPAAQTLGMLVPGVPGGPIFKSAGDLLKGIRQMDTSALVKMNDDVLSSLLTMKGKGKGKVKTPKREGPAADRAATEVTATSDAAEAELFRRARSGDPKALEWAENMADIDFLFDENISSLAEALEKDGPLKQEILQGMWMEENDRMAELLKADPLIQLFEFLTDVIAKARP